VLVLLDVYWPIDYQKNPKNNVAIFEAGKNSDIWKVNMPLALLYTMHDPKYNYKYYSEPEPHLK
jgi:choline dehydrogenase